MYTATSFTLMVNVPELQLLLLRASAKAPRLLSHTSSKAGFSHKAFCQSSTPSPPISPKAQTSIPTVPSLFGMYCKHGQRQYSLAGQKAVMN